MSQLKDLFSGMSGIAAQDLDERASFIELGADSLFLVQASQTIQDTFGVKVSFRLLLEENPSIDSLASYIDVQLPAEQPPPFGPPEQPAPPARTSHPARAPAAPRVTARPTVDDRQEPQRPWKDTEAEGAMPASKLEQIVARQIAVLAEQLRLLRESYADNAEDTLLEELDGANWAVESARTDDGRAASNGASAPMSPASAMPSAAVPVAQDGRLAGKTEVYVPYQPIRTSTAGGLSQRQQQHLDGLIARVTARTQGSKQNAQASRAPLADSRGPAGFRLQLKELLYPLTVERAAGAHVWDVDGNEYVDLTMGFGALLFGHSPSFVSTALHAQIDRGMQLGLESGLSGKAAALVCQLTGMERATFCNSGTEAVMTALRLARTVSGRDKVVLFAGSYHGFSDGVLVRAGAMPDGQPRSIPMAPGIPANVADNVLVLDYAAPASLERIKAHAHELAAVLVEPVQSRQPDLQPVAFLRELRDLTAATGIALIFDEVITGLRVHPAGTQGLFGVRADLATYGKTAGAGVPIGIVAGKAAYLDAIDGGMWRYGDGSYPEAERTFFAGTFFKHPLTMAAVWAVLSHLEASGPQLQEGLNQRTARLVGELNDFFEQADVPIRLVHFGSLFRFVFGPALRYPELFFYHLLEQGVYVWEGRNCFLSTAHDEDDLARIVMAVKGAVAELRAGEFLPPAASADHVAPALAPARDIPATVAQQGLWVVAQMGEDASRAYNESIALRLLGQLDHAAVRYAVQQVADRHEALRATLGEGGEVLHVAPQLTIDMPLVDLSTAGAAGPAEWLAQEARAVFDLSRGPLIRAHLVRVAEREHLLVLSMHHIITDGWSNGVLIQEIAALYSAARQGIAAQLPPPTPFSAYATWLVSRQGSPDLAAAENYWRAQFADPVPPLALPTDRPRPPLQTYRGARETLTIDATQLRDLRAVSARQGYTLFVALLAGFQALLHRLSCQDDLVAGIAAAGQPLFGSEQLVGYCVNLLPLRSRIAGDPRVAEHLTAVKRVLIDAQEHQEYPFSQLIRRLDLPRDPSRPPLVTAVFNMDRKPPTGPQLHDLTAEALPNLPDAAKYDIALNITQAEDTLQLDWEYNTDLFDAPTIRRWLGYFQTLLAGMAAHPGARLRGLPLLTEQERSQLLVMWNDTHSVYSDLRPIHALVAGQAARTPDAIAIVFDGLPTTNDLQPLSRQGDKETRRQGDQAPRGTSVLSSRCLSYRELDARANQLARHLRHLRIGPDRLVAICLERSPELVVGLLGILKAGGAYVPLDPTYPRERLAFMLHDARASVLLTQQHLDAGRWALDAVLPHNANDAVIQNPKSKIQNPVVVCLDADWSVIALESSAPLEVTLDGDSLAYMIYTSGSTGRPKGAMNSHAAIANRLLWMQATYGLTPDDRVLQKTTYSFDVSVWEFFWPLLSGAQLVLAQPEAHKDSAYLRRVIGDQGITTIHFVPSMLQAFVEEVGVETCHSLRRVICSGEALPYDLQERFFARLGAELHNLYGPTEAAVDVTEWTCRPGDARRTVPIGHPIANTQIYLLDPDLQPVPIGVAGELYIGGVQLARGYYARPDLTAERFVPNPFGGVLGDGCWVLEDATPNTQHPSPNTRLYRTGDLARYRPDGAIEYLGRIDHQVKLRGFRIELGEIEAALAQHPAVREAVVVMRGEALGDARLAAYVVPTRDQGAVIGEQEGATSTAPLSPAELRTFLKVRLPDYMVPAAFVVLDALPLTPSGKVDRRALPEPELTRPGLEETYVAPRTVAEEVLAEIWAHALDLDRVGIHDSFFAIGGDSIRGLRALAEARERGYHFALHDLFRHQTIADLVAALERSATTIVSLPQTKPFSLIAEADRLKLPADVEDAYPLTMLQAGMLYHMELTPQTPVYHNVNSLRLRGRLDPAALQAAIQQVVDRQPLLRTSFDLRTYSQPLQLVHKTAVLSLGLEDLRQLTEQDQHHAVAAYVETELQNRFEPLRPPLLRLQIHLLAEDIFQLTVTDFHPIIDGWGLATLLAEIANLHGLPDQRRPLETFSPTVTFRDYVLLERMTAEAEPVRRYWSEMMRDVIPTKLPRWPAAPQRAGELDLRRLSLPIPAAIFADLRRLNQATAIPLKSLLLAVHAKVLSVAAGQTDITTGMIWDGRLESLGSEKVLGLHLNMLPFRLQLNRGTWVDLARMTFETEIAALPFRRYPVAALQKSYGASALFEATFNFVHFHNLYGITRSGTMQLLDLSYANNDMHYPLSVTFVLLQSDNPDGSLSLQLRYDANELCDQQIDHICEYYANALQQIADDPYSRHDLQALLGTQERHTLLVHWNDTASSYPNEACLHELFAAQVARTPEAVALIYDDSYLTFRELEARANKLARHLRRLGVGPETRVGLCVERSPEMIVGLLGILTAGGAYVPLDSSYPKQRLQLMLADSRAPVLVTMTNRQAGTGDWRMGDQSNSQSPITVYLDSDWPAIAQERDVPPAVTVMPENLAYVLYTSGSTGAPKGVMIQHRSVINLATGLARTIYAQQRGAQLRVGMNGPLVFDTSIKQLVQLLDGHTLQILPQEIRFDGAALSAYLRRIRLDVFDCTPAQLEIVLAEEPPGGPAATPPLVLLGGEAISDTLWCRLTSTAGRRFYNLYGPTECTVDTTIERISPEAPGPLIGRPIANVQTYVLDQQMQPAPIGVPGELYVGGHGLARGYLDHPDRTAERFVPNPFGRMNDEDRTMKDAGELDAALSFIVHRSSLGERLYRTGDLARWLADGTLEFLGRIDDQVKVRGFRIELAEIATVLQRHPVVREAIVLAREDTPGARRLVAYVVRRSEVRGQGSEDAALDSLTPDPRPLIPELRGFLESHLPQYMVPAAFVLMERLPLTPNGKIDRRALPIPDAARPSLETIFVAPRTPIEERLAAIWTQVLGLTQVGIHDNFFELGGDSIISIQIVAKAHQAGLHLTPAQVFQHRTIAELAAVTERASGDAGEEEPVSGPLPLTPIQHWFFEQQLPDPRAWAQTMVVQTRHVLDTNTVAQAAAHILTHHDAFRLRFVRQGAGWRQDIAAPPRTPPIMRVDLSALPEPAHDQAVRAAVDAAVQRIDLAAGQLLQIMIIDRGAHLPGLLVLATHTLAIDGLSQRILAEDLQTIYRQLIHGAELRLPLKTTSFKRWAERLVDYAQSEELQSELTYWVAQAWGSVAPLPVDNSAGTSALDEAGTLMVTLNQDETRALLHEIPRVYHTEINDVLLTALARSFAEWSTARTLLIDLRGHGREPLFADVDVSRTIGWFTSIFPVLLDLGVSTDPGSELKTIKEQLRQIPHHGIGYGILRYLSTDAAAVKRLRALPKPQVSFNYRGRFDLLAEQDLFAPADAFGELARELWSPRYLIEVQGGIVADELRIIWKYSRTIHRRETVERLAHGFVRSLRALIAHCQSPHAGSYTPSDFPAAHVSRQELDSLIARVVPAGQHAAEQIEDIYMLSPLQQGMLFHSLYAPTAETYFQQMGYAISTRLNVATFERAWQAVLDRHPVLHSSFHWDGLRTPLQVVHRQVPLPVERHDWRMLAPAEQQRQMEDYLAADRQRGFDLTCAPALRLALVQLAEDQYYLVWSHHHILLDGWSAALVLKEVLSLYEAFGAQQEIDLDRNYPFRIYIDWLQRQHMSGAETFWRERLTGFSAPTPLPTDQPGVSENITGHAEQHIQLSVATSAALLALARQHQITLSTVLQGIWALLLSHYSGEEDVLFGTTFSGRPPELPGVESIVGMLINTLPVRVRINAHESAATWLQHLQAQQVAMQQYEHSSLVQIQGWSDMQRGTPLFESLVIFENYPIDEALRAQNRRLPIASAHVFEHTNYPLTLVAGIQDAALRLRLGYERRRFDANIIARLLGHMRLLLESLISAPRQPLSTLPTLTADERYQVLTLWNATQATYLAEQAMCLHQLFEAQVGRTPDAVALVHVGTGNWGLGTGDWGLGDSQSPTPNTQQLTYAELDRRANQVAQALRRMGVGPETRVGIRMERSLELVVGVLGILKAGGAYLPLDPAHPQEREAFIIADARTMVLLSGHAHQDGRMKPVGERSAADLHASIADSQPPVEISIHDLSADSAYERAAPLDSTVTPDNLAYVIYTSGSTGQPKGVQIAHQAVVNFLCAMRGQLGLSQRDVLLAVTTLAFDIAALELFLPLTIGARVVLSSHTTATDGARLAQALDAAATTVMQATPATWRMLVESGWQGRSGLSILCGGELLPRQLADQLLDRSACVWNLYGPTETTIWSAATLVDHMQDQVPIGRPIANTQIYVLDRYLRPVPVGVPGELYIGGAGVARGYLDRPDLTAERFIPNPFVQGMGDGGWGMEDKASNTQHPSPNTRLYRTGDLARYRADGMIEFLGRDDHQIKLRGFRIELGEIEAALTQHPALRSAVVLARAGRSGDTRLVAYVTLADDQAHGWPTGQLSDRLEGADQSGAVAGATASFADMLRAFLRASLPDYMIPSSFVTLDALPLTPNGKIDRRALPDAEGQRPELNATYQPPRSGLEHSIAMIWQAVLEINQVGRNDNFFDLGGHSLLMVRVQSQLRDAIGRPISMIELFTYPTISALAERLRQAAAPAALFTEASEQVEIRSDSARRRRDLRKKSWSAEHQQEDSDA